jgi:peptidoglycan hydrolase-like protein with peptidoglycan-binding domain
MTDIPLDTDAEIFAALKKLGFNSYTFEGAVKAFQFKRLIEVDGIAGPETKKQIELALEK